MKICVFGAGAVGGFVAMRLARAGNAVSVITRGPSLAAMRANGLTLVSGGMTETARIAATDTPAELGPQDAVMVTTKAQAMPEVAAAIAPLLGPETPVVAAQNGIPWWYFHRQGAALEGLNLASVDPGGAIWRAIGPERAIGCVVTCASSVAAPGIVHHQSGKTFALGEPDGTASARIARISRAFTDAGLEAPIRARIRDDLWTKLWGNISFSQIAVLTGSGLASLARDPGAAQLARVIMAETQAVAERLGVRFTATIAERMQGTTRVGDHKTSILQDLEAGRPMEIDAQVGAVIEIARRLGVATPMCEAIYALVRKRAQLAGCYPAQPSFDPFAPAA